MGAEGVRPLGHAGHREVDSPAPRLPPGGAAEAVKGILVEKLVKAAEIENEIEAQMLRAVLEDRGVPHVMRSYRDGTYDGLFQATRGWGVVLAPLSHREQVREILRELRGRSQAQAPES